MRATSILAAAASLLVPSCTSVQSLPRKNIPFLSIDFEPKNPGYLPNGVDTDSPPAPEAITIVETPARQGPYSTRIMVKNAPEYIFADKVRKIRAEYTTRKNPNTSFREGDKRRYNFSLMLSSDWIFDAPSSIDIVWQFKRTASKPDMFIAIKGHDLVLRIGNSSQVKLIANLRTGTWMDLSLVVNLTSSNAGKIEFFYRYEDQEEYRAGSTYTGATLANRQGETYLKWGIYKPDNYQRSISLGPHILFFDNISVVRE